MRFFRYWKNRWSLFCLQGQLKHIEMGLVETQCRVDVLKFERTDVGIEIDRVKARIISHSKADSLLKSIWAEL